MSALPPVWVMTQDFLLAHPVPDLAIRYMPQTYGRDGVASRLELKYRGRLLHARDLTYIEIAQSDDFETPLHNFVRNTLTSWDKLLAQEPLPSDSDPSHPCLSSLTSCLSGPLGGGDDAD